MKHTGKMKQTSKCESDLLKQGYTREDARMRCSEGEGSKSSEKREYRDPEKSPDDLDEEIE